MLWVSQGESKKKANKVNFIYLIDVLLPVHYVKIAVRLWEYISEQIRKKNFVKYIFY